MKFCQILLHYEWMGKLSLDERRFPIYTEIGKVHSAFSGMTEQQNRSYCKRLLW